MQTQTRPYIANLCLNNRLSDFTVYIGETKTNAWKFPVHQLALSAASNVFEAMFRATFAEKREKEVLIKDISPYAFRKLLIFVYRGILNTESITEALELLHAADKYNIEALQLACFNQIIHHKITLENVWILWAHYVTFDERLTSQEMKMRIMKFIDENASEILRHESQFSQCKNIALIISRDTFNVPEIALCDALETWSRMQCFSQQLESTAENQRSVLGEAFYYIRFGLIPRRELLKHPIFEMLTDVEKLQMLHQPDQLPPPWDQELLTKPRKRYWIWNQHSINELDHLRPTTCFVFAKDTFVRSMVIRMAELDDPFTEVVITAMSDGSTVECDIFFDGSDLNVCNAYFKAFVCYKLEVDSDHAFAICSEDGEVWGYEGDTPVFFSVSANEVLNEECFASIDYWRTVFSRRPPMHDPDVLCFGNLVVCNTVENVCATFC